MRFHVCVLVAFGLMGAGCMEATGPQANTPPDSGPQVKAVSATTLSGDAGFVLADPVRVQVVDGAGAAMAGQTVTFEVTGGGGSVSPTSATTDASGIATTQWTLGPTAGTNTLKASSGGSAVTITATGAEGIGATIQRVSGGTTDSLPAGCTLPQPLVVKVLGKDGNPAAGATVGFQIVNGDGTVGASEVRTGADGQASTAFRVGFTGGANVVRAVLHVAAQPSVDFSARSAPAAPNGFSVLGNKIYDPGTCQPILFHGAARPALEWWYNGDDEYVQFAQQAAMLKSWGANLIRIPISQSFWVPGTYWNKQAVAAGTDYKAKVVDAVTKARALGLTVIVDLHTSDRGDPNYTATPDIWKMPDVNNSIPFWRDVATTFKNDGGVIFELYNEPHPREDVWVEQQLDPQAWTLWRDGGVVEAGKDYPCDACATLPAYNGAGMQQLYDVVRGVGARNLVLVNGVHWGYSLAGVPQYRVKGYNIIYGSHPYDWPDKQPDQFDKEFGFLAATDPVMISEFGSYKCDNLEPGTLGLAYNRAVLDYADAHGLSWVAWRFWSPPAVSATYTAAQRAQDICSTSALLTDWNGTPSASGQLVKDRLATYH